MIKQKKYLNIGRVEQFIDVRGSDKNNPLILFLHGGPGAPLSCIADELHDKFKENFIIANWDQRGAGKSFSPNIPVESMTIDQLVSDTIEVTDYLRKEYNKDKIYLLGISFGSIIGLIAAYKHPEKYHAYISSGQVVNIQKNEEVGYDLILDFVKQKENNEAIEELIKNSYPYDDFDTGMMTRLKWVREYGFGERVSSRLYMKFNQEEIQELLQGIGFSDSNIMPKLVDLNLDYITELKLPVYFLEGRNDYQVPSINVKDYFDILQAPEKEFIWFEDSAHDAVFTEAEKFVDYIINRIK